jgi:hypothetical protein
MVNFLDEFSLGDIKKKEQLENKYGYQLGVKYYDAFGEKFISSGRI